MHAILQVLLWWLMQLQALPRCLNTHHRRPLQHVPSALPSPSRSPVWVCMHLLSLLSSRCHPVQCSWEVPAVPGILAPLNLSLSTLHPRCVLHTRYGPHRYVQHHTLFYLVVLSPVGCWCVGVSQASLPMSILQRPALWGDTQTS